MAISGITSAISGPKNTSRAVAARQGGGFQQAFLQKVEALIDQIRGPRTELRQQIAQAGGAPPKPVQQQVTLLAQRLSDLGVQREQTIRSQADVQTNLKNIQEFLAKPAASAPRPALPTAPAPSKAQQPGQALPNNAANLAASDDALAGTDAAPAERQAPRLAPLAAKGLAPGRQSALEGARIQVLQAFEAIAAKDIGADEPDESDAPADAAELGGDRPADYQAGLRTAARAYQATLEAANTDLRARLAEIDTRIDATQRELQALSAPSGVAGARRRAGPPVVSPAQLDQQALELFTQARETSGGIAEARRPPVKTMVYAVQSMVTFNPRGQVMSLTA